VAKTHHLLLFGGTGAIGTAIAQHAASIGWQVTIITRRTDGVDGHVRWNPLDANDAAGQHAVAAAGPFDAVTWAQGQNAADSVYDVDMSVLADMFDANVGYVVASLRHLLGAALLTRPARLVIISSIWQNLARQNKLSYSVTKAALQGLVLSAANDLGRDGHLVNAALPGVIDTPMARRNLSPDQIADVTGATQFGRLPDLGDVARAVTFLCSLDNTGITGQFVDVDLGYSRVRYI
jgi:hypothetical protein